ncbi:MAG: hypothetical protein K2X45_11600 [Phreatobacter sp.]|nr:hypothetical protein [Phreatobacter sp.]
MTASTVPVAILATGGSRAARARRRPVYALRSGLALLELILAIVILAFLGTYVAREIQASNRVAQARMLGTRWTQLTEAADAYIRGNDARIRQALTDASIVISVPMTDAATLPNQRGLPSFRAANVLGAGFVDADGYGNRTILYIFTPPASAANPTPPYEAFLVSSGGRRIPDDVLTAVTGFSDSRVGVALSQNPPGQQANTMRGFRGGWEAPLTTFSALAGSAPTIGSVSSYVSLQRGANASQSRYLSRVDTGNPVDNLMETDIDMGEQGLRNLTRMEAGASGTITARGDLSVTPGNAGSPGNVTAAGVVTGDRGVFNNIAPGTPAEQAASATPGLSVPGVARIGNLSAQNLDVDTLVYSASGARAFRSGVRLRDLLPQIVHKASYVSTDNQIVPKPTDCLAGEGRVFIYPQIIENASDIGVTVSGALEYVTLPVVNSVSVSGVAPDYTINVETSNINVLPQRGPTDPSPLILQSATDPARFRSVAFAQDQGTFWVINLYSQQGVPNGAGVLWQTVPSATRALVQTACVYP